MSESSDSSGFERQEVFFVTLLVDLYSGMYGGEAKVEHGFLQRRVCRRRRWRESPL